MRFTFSHSCPPHHADPLLQCTPLATMTCGHLNVLPVRSGTTTRAPLYRQHRSPLPSSSQPARGAAPTPHALVPAGMCFSDACQAAQDRAFALAVLCPLAGLAVAIARWATAKPPLPARPGGTTFEDTDTGLAFEAGPGEAPELDRQGNLVYRAVRYTPQPVEAGAPGARVRVAVGPIKTRAPRTFVFERVLGVGGPSRVFGVALPRPLGITWAEDEASGRIVVGELSGEAERRAAAAALDPVHLRTTALAPGDVLRAITATTVVFRGAGALTGWSPGTREIVLFGADGAKWAAVRGALRKGDAADGDVTVVVERAMDSAVRAAAAMGDVSDELNPDR